MLCSTEHASKRRKQIGQVVWCWDVFLASAERPKLGPSELDKRRHAPARSQSPRFYSPFVPRTPFHRLLRRSVFDCSHTGRQVSVLQARPSSQLRYDACYLYGMVAVCVALAASCDTGLRYGAAAHASLPRQNALPLSCTRDIPHQI